MSPATAYHFPPFLIENKKYVREFFNHSYFSFSRGGGYETVASE